MQKIQQNTNGKNKKTLRGEQKNQAEGIAIDKATVDGMVERWDDRANSGTKRQNTSGQLHTLLRRQGVSPVFRQGTGESDRIGSDRGIGWVDAGMGAGNETTLARPAVSQQPTADLGALF